MITDPPSISSISGLEDYDTQEFYKFVRTDFIDAARRGDIVYMQNLVAQGTIMPGVPSMALLDIAGRVRPRSGNLKVIKFLVEELGADIDSNKEQLLLAGIDHKQVEIIEYYIEREPEFYKLLSEIIDRGYWAHAVEMKSLIDKRALEKGIVLSGKPIKEEPETHFKL